MATNTIGLKIELNGFIGVITNIKQLEDELRKSKEDLKELEIGSNNFKVLTAEIRKAESQLIQLNKAAKGLTVQEKFEKFAKIGSAVTSSFAGAQAAVQLFGSDTEKVSEAAAKAQNILTLALVGREIAEGVVAASAVATTTATVGETAATNTLTSSLQRLYLTVLANPFTALLAVIGAVGVAFTIFGSKTDDAKKKSKEFQQQVNKDAGKEITDTKLLINSINDSSLSINTRQKAIDDLRAKFPAYFKDLKDEDLLSGKVKIKTDELTQAIIRQSTARALQGRLEERAASILDIEDQLAEATKNRIALQEKLNTAESSSSMTPGGGGGGNIISLQTRYNTALQEENRLKGEKNKLDKLNATDIERVNKLNQQNNNIIGTGTKELKTNTAAKTENNQATKEQIALYAQLEKELNAEVKSIENITAVFQKLASANKVDIGSPQLLKDLQALTSSITGLIPPTLEDQFKKVGLSVEFIDGKYKVLSNTLIEGEDIFGKFIETIRKDLSAGAIQQPLDEFDKTLNKINDDASKLFQEGLITKEALNAAITLTNQYKDFNKIIKELPKDVQKIFTPELLNEYLTSIKNISIATGDIQFEKDINGEIVKITNSTIKLSQEEEKLLVVQEQIRTSLIEGYKKDFIVNGEFNTLRLKEIVNNLVKEDKLNQEQADKLLQLKTSNTEEQLKLINELSNAQVEALNTTTKNIVAEENQIRTFLFQIQQEREKGIEAQSKALPAVVLNNLEALDEALRKSGKIVVDETKNIEEQRSQLIQDFASKKLNLIGFTEKQIDDIIIFYLNKQKDAKDKEAKDDVDRQNKRKAITSQISSDIQAFQSALTSLSQYTSDYYNNELSQLDKHNKQVQSTIIGDTEQANQKRIEAEKQYQNEKAQIEKEASKRSLQITLAQALANFAASIVKVSEQTGVFAPIAAGVISAINLAQIVMIQKQIDALGSFQHGGIVKAASGLIVGPSHEFGGVMLGNGVNAEGGESIINRQSTVQYRGLLSQINQSGGGKPLVNNFDDSRIIEALAKQKSEPIRAYVIEQDISSKQAVSRRLQELSRI